MSVLFRGLLFRGLLSRWLLSRWPGGSAGAVLVLTISCGQSRATAVDDFVPEDSGAGSGGAAGSNSDGSSSAPDAAAAAGAAGAAGAAASGQLCSTNIGSCRFDSAAQCPAAQPAEGSACGGSALVCYYCPVAAFSLAVSSCAGGRWSSARVSCGG